MGSSYWSEDFYRDREVVRKKAGKSAFAYHDTVAKAAPHEQKVHKLLDPKGVKIRESRDSKEHPNSNAIAFLCDVTGSMASTPRVIQQALPNLMGLLDGSKYVTDPQVLFGAIGDARSDRGPLQVGQFESGIEMDDDIQRLWLEGNGGGSGEESYELALYWLARHTSIDCQEKRGKKGYAFLVGDEKPYPVVSRSQVEALIGDSLEADIPIADIIKEVREKYHLYFVIPQETSYRGDASVYNTWVKLLGPDFVLKLGDASAICETIGLAVGLNESTITLATARETLKSRSVNDRIVNSALAAVGPLAQAKGQVGEGTTMRL